MIFLEMRRAIEPRALERSLVRIQPSRSEKSSTTSPMAK